MKVKISQNQFDRLKNNINFIKKVKVRFTDFTPDEKWQPTFVYINGMPKSDIELLQSLKLNNQDSIVTLINAQTKEVFQFPLDEITFTKSGGFPKISKDEYNKIKDELETHEIVLNPYFLKKKVSGFPKFITNTLFSLYPNNIGKNSFIKGDGICDSENGLINIPNTNIPNETWSILNYFDTNPMVIKKLIEWFMSGEFSDNNPPNKVSIRNFKDWITKNSRELFMEGTYLTELVDLNLNSYMSGTKTEEKTIKNLTKEPFNIKRDKIKRFCSGSKSDRVDGQDIEIITENGVYYAQIKPYSWFKINEDTKKHVIKTYQMKNYKNKPIQYIIFTSGKNMMIFENKDYTIQKDTDYVVFKNPPLENIK
jgi:hypothetical protein